MWGAVQSTSVWRCIKPLCGYMGKRKITSSSLLLPWTLACAFFWTGSSLVNGHASWEAKLSLWMMTWWNATLGQSCHENLWWFTVCFSQISYAFCPRTIDDSIVYGDCEHDRHHLWILYQDFFLPSKPCKMLALCCCCQNHAINIAVQPAWVESFKRCFKKLQTNCVRRSGRNRWLLLAVLQETMAAASSSLSAAPDRRIWGSYSCFWACTATGRKGFSRRDLPLSHYSLYCLSGVRSREPGHNWSVWLGFPLAGLLTCFEAEKCKDPIFPT